MIIVDIFFYNYNFNFRKGEQFYSYLRIKEDINLLY